MLDPFIQRLRSSKRGAALGFHSDQEIRGKGACALARADKLLVRQIAFCPREYFPSDSKYQGIASSYENSLLTSLLMFGPRPSDGDAEA